MSHPTKKQHYVPQFLLRYFAADGDAGVIFVFDKKTRVTSKRSIRDVAHENYFYERNPAQPVSFELQLSRLEGDVSAIMRDVVVSGDASSIGESVDLLSFFVATQALRTRQQRRYSMRTWEALKEAVGKKGLSAVFPDLTEFPTEEYFRTHQAERMHFMAPLISGKLETRSWILLNAAPLSAFCLGDHPVVVWNRSEDSSVGLSPLEPGAEVYVPITPRMCLLVVAEAYQKRAIAALTDGIIDTPTIQKSVAMPSNRVYRQNGLQVVFAERFVFSQNSDFEFAKDVLSSNPQFAEGPTPENDSFDEFLVHYDPSR